MKELFGGVVVKLRTHITAREHAAENTLTGARAGKRKYLSTEGDKPSSSICDPGIKELLSQSIFANSSTDNNMKSPGESNFQELSPKTIL
jgi:hypothetical protein